MLRTLFYVFLICVLPLTALGQGVLDLRRAENLESIALQTDWQFYFGELMSAEEMQNADHKAYYTMPDSWKGYDWNGKKLPAYGFATYYLKVLVDSSMQEMALKVPPMGTTSKVFVNDQFLGEVGVVGTSAETSVPDYKDVIYRFPVNSGYLDIIIQVSNYDYRKGGLWQIPVIGTVEGVFEHKLIKYQLEYLVFGTILFMGLYHFVLYVFKFKNRLNVVFGLICLITVVRAASVGQYVLTDVFPGMPWSLLIRIEFITFLSISILTIIFIRGLFQDYFPAVVEKIIVGYFLLMVLLTLFLSPAISSYLITPIQVANLLAALFCFYVLFKAIIDKNVEAIIFMIGFAILIAAIFNDFLFYNNIWATGSYFAVGLCLYFFTHAMILARRFSYAFFQVNKLTIKLQDSNRNLENKVQKRTVKIEMQNDELLQKNNQLEKLNEEKDGLISVIAHDLKAPFNRTKGLLNLLKLTGDLNGEQEETLNMIHSSTDQGFQLISDLLLLYGESKATLHKAPVDLLKVLSQVGKAYQQLADEKDIKLHLHLPDSTVTCITDQALLERTLDNLLTNAIKFSNSGRNVYLTMFVKDGKVVLTVRDEGPGISVEEQKLLFKKFQKLTAKPTAGESSTGLGLSIVKEIVEQLNGKIEVESEVGKGTEFKLTFELTTT